MAPRASPSMYGGCTVRPYNETRMEARWKLGRLLARVERGSGAEKIYSARISERLVSTAGTTSISMAPTSWLMRQITR